mmetsp:Transcript_7914/g.15531  ORF Transcript_7914/g.15531 Transcript_7914/m.15531 type:complete len:240 (+) Transcript_7914:120-839(+)
MNYGTMLNCKDLRQSRMAAAQVLLELCMRNSACRSSRRPKHGNRSPLVDQLSRDSVNLAMHEEPRLDGTFGVLVSQVPRPASEASRTAFWRTSSHAGPPSPPPGSRASHDLQRLALRGREGVVRLGQRLCTGRVGFLAHGTGRGGGGRRLHRAGRLLHRTARGPVELVAPSLLEEHHVVDLAIVLPRVRLGEGPCGQLVVAVLAPEACGVEDRTLHRYALHHVGRLATYNALVAAAFAW